MYSKNINIRDILCKERNPIKESNRSMVDLILGRNVSQKNNDTSKIDKAINRIISNHNTFISDNTKLPVIREGLSLESMAYDVCRSIDSYDMSNSKKYIVSIIETSYLLDKERLAYDESELINTITDYYALREDTTDIDMNNMKKGLYDLLNEVDDCQNYNVYLLEDEDFADTEDIKKLVEKFKKSTEKNESKLKNIVIKLYSKTPEQIIDETPFVFGLLRNCIIVGAVAINPILGLITLITDKWIGMTVSRNQTEKFYKMLKKEQNKIEDKLMFDDDKVSEKMKSYNKCLSKCIDSVEDYMNTLYTDDEMDTLREIRDLSTYSVNNTVLYEDFEYVAGDICRDINEYEKELKRAICNSRINESCKFYNNFSISSREELANYLDANNHFTCMIAEINSTNYDAIYPILDTVNESLKYRCKNLLFTYDKYISEDASDSIACFLTSNNQIVFDSYEEDEYFSEHSMAEYELIPMFLIETISNMIDEIDDLKLTDMTYMLTSNVNTLIENSLIMPISSIIAESGNMIESSVYKEVLSEKCRTISSPTLETEISYAVGILEDNIIDELNPVSMLEIQLEAGKLLTMALHEEINLSSLKVAAVGLMNKAKSLSAKEKETSKKFDMMFDTFRRNIEKSLTTDRRESIIKGSIIPSASKCIKFALATSAAFLVNPVLAVIGALGALAISKKCTTKERQIILDEIEIEIKSVNKEIQIADSDQNSKKYKQLLLYKKRLEREAQRIRYNININGGSIPASEEEGDDD